MCEQNKNKQKRTFFPVSFNKHLIFILFKFETKKLEIVRFGTIFLRKGEFILSYLRTKSVKGFGAF